MRSLVRMRRVVAALFLLAPSSCELLLEANHSIQYRGEREVAVLAIPGDTSGGCSWRVGHLGGSSCCYSSRGGCGPLQAPGCRQGEVTEGEEEGVEACRLRLDHLVVEDTGRYQVTFPARQDDNTVFSLDVWRMETTTPWTPQPGAGLGAYPVLVGFKWNRVTLCEYRGITH